MLNLKELLKQEKQIWFKVEKCDKIIQISIKKSILAKRE